MPASPSNRYLLADDDPVVRRTLEYQLKKANLFFRSFPDGESLLAACDDDTTVVIVDLIMPGKGGLEVIQAIKSQWPQVQVIVLTAVDKSRETRDCLREGAFNYLTKPFDPEEVILSVRKATEMARASAENVALRDPLPNRSAMDGFVGDSPWAQRMRAEVQRLGALDSTILITGESGTGKGVLARALHQASPRAAASFVAVSCPSLPRELVESEMFGHERGAFTGAAQRRLGRAEMADKGTLFLDEIGEMPLELQAKLLTFLQDKQFYRVGGERPLASDVRLVAATNRDLPDMVRRGAFRQDLYYRLNVVPLRLPPLREHPEDIPGLVEHFLAKLSPKRSPRPKFAPEALALLVRYPWPGNVRELENAIERCLAFARDGRITTGDLPEEIREATAQPTAADAAASTSAAGGLRLAGRALEDIEFEAISQTLALCRGNRTEAARLLGVTEKTIYNRLKAREQATTAR